MALDTSGEKKKVKKSVKMIADLCTRCNQCTIACGLIKFDAIDLVQSYVRLLGDGDEVTKIKLTKGCDLCGDCFDACHYGAMEMTIKEIG